MSALLRRMMQSKQFSPVIDKKVYEPLKNSALFTNKLDHSYTKNYFFLFLNTFANLIAKCLQISHIFDRRCLVSYLNPMDGFACFPFIISCSGLLTSFHNCDNYFSILIFLGTISKYKLRLYI